MQDQVAKKSIQKAFKTSFAHILKTLKSLEFLLVFGGSGTQDGSLEGLRRATWDPLGDFGEAFLHFSALEF